MEKVLKIFLIFCLSLGPSRAAKCEIEWRSFDDNLEATALSGGSYNGGTQAFIGRAVAGKGHTPGRIALPQTFYYTAGANVKSIRTNFEYLVDDGRYTFKWERGSTCVSDAVTVGDKWYIGRVTIGDNTFVGKVEIGSDSLNYDNTRGGSHFVATYEVLTCTARETDPDVERRLEELQAEVGRLRERLETATGDLEKEKDKNKRLEAENSRMTGEISRLVAENSRVTADYSGLQRRLDDCLNPPPPTTTPPPRTTPPIDTNCQNELLKEKRNTRNLEGDVTKCETKYRNLLASSSTCGQDLIQCNAALKKAGLEPVSTHPIAIFKSEVTSGGFELEDVRDLFNWLESELPPEKQNCYDLSPRMSLPCDYYEILNCTFTKTRDNDYQCTAMNLEIEHQNSNIYKVSGEHFTGKNPRSVTQLIIKNQKIKYLPSGLPKRFVNLRELTIEDSDLRSLLVGTFENFKNLQVLQITGNRFKNVKVGVFLGLDNLRQLDLSNNGITEIHKNAFRGLRKLTKLKINDNNLATLEAIFDCDNRIQSLYAHNNRISTVDSTLLNCMPLATLFTFNGNKCYDTRDTDAGRVIQALREQC